MQGCELPQVGHVNRGAVSDQQLGHLVVSVGTGVMEGDQPAARRTHRHSPLALLHALARSSLRRTLCPWRARRPRGAAGTPPPTLCCNRRRNEAAWSVGPPDPGSSHSEPCTATADGERERIKAAPNRQGGADAPANPDALPEDSRSQNQSCRLHGENKIPALCHLRANPGDDWE